MTDAEWEARLEGCCARVLRGLVGVCGSLPDAEDALQEALVAALRVKDRDAIERLDGWLYVVALRALRRRRWRRRLERALDGLHLTQPGPGVQRVYAVELLRDLTPRQREVVVARFWLDLSYAEIAERFGISVGTATSTVTRALERIRASAEDGP